MNLVDESWASAKSLGGPYLTHSDHRFPRQEPQVVPKGPYPTRCRQTRVPDGPPRLTCGDRGMGCPDGVSHYTSIGTRLIGLDT